MSQVAISHALASVKIIDHHATLCDMETVWGFLVLLSFFCFIPKMGKRVLKKKTM